MYIKIVRDDSKIFRLGGSLKDDATWGILETSGIGESENDISTAELASGDGEDIINERIPKKFIDITASVKNRKYNAIERGNAMAFFNPKHTYTLYVTQDEVTRWIRARIQKFSCPPKRPDEHASLQTALICVDPYFYSVEDYGKNIAAVTGCFGFPYISPVNVGFRVGEYNFAKKVEVENTGDVETYATIVIIAKGTVVNPKIIQNDAYIRLLDTLESGDTVEIDMVGNTIKKNGKNCIGKVDRKSSFSRMVLSPGNNEVSYDADNGDTKMQVFLYYHLKYLGV